MVEGPGSPDVDEFLGIGEVARASGLPVTALRFYDGAGVLVPAGVDPRTGYRRYAPVQVAAARLVARLRRVGLPLPEVRALLAGGDPGPVLDAHLTRLEAGLVDARRELAAVRSLLTPEAAMRLTLPAADLAAALAAVRYAVGSDPEHPQLHGVLLDPDGGTLWVVASDRYRLATASLPLPEPAGGRRVLLPVALVDAARPLLAAGEATVTVDGGTVEIAAGGSAVRGPVLPGEFPDWRRLEPGPATQRVTLDGAAFRAELAAGPVLRRDPLGETVVLVLGPDGGLSVGGAADGLRVAVNRDFLLDAVPAAGQLVLDVDTPERPLAVRVPGHPDWSLLMPVRDDEPAA